MSYVLKKDPGYCGDPRRGASLGRGGATAADKAAPIKFHLRRVRLDNGGYDPGGAYWGIGSPLYHAMATDHHEVLRYPGVSPSSPLAKETVWDCPELFFRARDRDAAKAEVLKTYPAAVFFR